MWRSSGLTTQTAQLPAVNEAPAWSRSDSSRRNGLVLGTLAGFATATQIRTGGSAGPFEVLIITYSVVVLRRADAGVAVLRTHVGRLLAGFIVAGGLGGMISVMAGWSSPSKVFIGLLPYVFALIGLEVVSQHDDRRTALKWWLLSYGTVVIVSQLVLYVLYLIGYDSLGPIELFVGDRERTVRFLGWASNPNQLAMTLTIAGAAIAASARSRLARFIAFGLVMFLGLATGSDGLRVALLVGTALVAVAIVIGRLRTSTWARVAVVAVTLAGIAVVGLNFSSLAQSAEDTANDGSQAEQRFELWASCVPSIVSSPLVGLGPGSHGELEGQPRSCHNTYVEAATFGGVPATLGLLLFLGVLAVRQMTRGQALVLFLLGQAATQMVFSFFFRYPQLWMLFLALEVGVLTTQMSPDRRETSYA